MIAERTALHLKDGDTAFGRALCPIFERKPGRILANGFPTVVEVCDSMERGGPYPAKTHSGGTSVGALSFRRFLRPNHYQNISVDILPGGILEYLTNGETYVSGMSLFI